MAEGAVLFFSSALLMPQAAQSRFESCWLERSLPANSRLVLRFFRAFIKGIPPSVWGGSNLVTSWADNLPGTSVILIMRIVARKLKMIFFMVIDLNDLQTELILK